MRKSMESLGIWSTVQPMPNLELPLNLTLKLLQNSRELTQAHALMSELPFLPDVRLRIEPLGANS